MKLLILQFVDPHQTDAMPVFSQDLGVMSALLKADGAEVHLAAMPGFRPDLLRGALEAHSPRCVLVELDPYNVTAARRTLAELAETYRLPVVVLGPYATCRPRAAISMPGVKALLLGEYAQTAAELVRAWQNGRSPAGIEGLWVHTGGKLVHGELPVLTEDLDSLPPADRDLFDYDRIVQADRQVAFKVARGCEQWCAYCFNDWYMDLYAEKGTFVRRRSVANVLDEVEAVVQRYHAAQSVRFYDHCFATDAEWLSTFAAEYPGRCKLPYRCHVRLNRLDEPAARLLGQSGCRWADVQIISGSHFIRDEIFSMRTGDEQIVHGCQRLHDAEIKVSAEVFVGSPYESDITVEDTLALLRRAEVDEVRPHVYFPTPGTRAAELAAESGWISGRGEGYYWDHRSVLDMPSMPADQIDAVLRKLPALVKGRRFTSLHKLLGKIAGSRRTSAQNLRDPRSR